MVCDESLRRPGQKKWSKQSGKSVKNSQFIWFSAPSASCDEIRTRRSWSICSFGIHKSMKMPSKYSSAKCLLTSVSKTSISHSSIQWIRERDRL